MAKYDYYPIMALKPVSADIYMSTYSRMNDKVCFSKSFRHCSRTKFLGVHFHRDIQGTKLEDIPS